MGKIDIEQYVETIDFGCKYNVRIQRVCRENRIVTIRDLCQWHKRSLMGMRDFGNNSILEIETFLKKHGLCLGMSGEELDKYAGVEKQEETEEALWEQRRYEIAKELCVHRHEPAYIAVEEADKLIEYLKGSPKTDAILKACKTDL